MSVTCPSINILFFYRHLLSPGLRETLMSTSAESCGMTSFLCCPLLPAGKNWSQSGHSPWRPSPRYLNPSYYCVLLLPNSVQMESM